MTDKLYVAGLSWNSTDDTFRDFFTQYGEVTEATIMRGADGRSRGFGFITFKDPASASNAVSQQGLTLDGRRLDIKAAVPKGEMAQQTPYQQNNSDEPPDAKKLYVAGVQYTCTEDIISSFFARFGTVETVTIMKDRTTGRSRGFCFVSFVDVGPVADVLAEHAQTKLEMEGRTLDLKAAMPRGAVGGGFGGSMVQPKKLFVAGLDTSTTEETFQSHFAQFGVVAEAYIQKDRSTGVSRGFGFVTYDSKQGVDKAMNAIHTVDGAQLDCKLAVPKPQMMRQQQERDNGAPEHGGMGSWAPRASDVAALNAYATHYARGPPQQHGSYDHHQQGPPSQQRGQPSQQQQAPPDAYRGAPRQQPANAYLGTPSAGYGGGAYGGAGTYGAGGAGADAAYNAYAAEAQQQQRQPYGGQSQQAYAPAASPYQSANGYGPSNGYEDPAGYGAYGDRRSARPAVGFHPYSRS